MFYFNVRILDGHHNAISMLCLFTYVLYCSISFKRNRCRQLWRNKKYLSSDDCVFIYMSLTRLNLTICSKKTGKESASNYVSIIREGRRRPILRWEDRVKRDLAGVGGEWRMRARDRGGVETVGGDGSEMGLVTKKKGEKLTAGISASIPLDYREKRRATYTVIIFKTFIGTPSSSYYELSGKKRKLAKVF